MLERTSAIASGLARGGFQPKGVAGCRLGEVRGWSLLQVAGFRGSIGQVERAVADAFGVGVPASVGIAAHADDATLLRTGPEQIWIIGPGESLAQEAKLRSTLTSDVGVLTSLSHSRTWMFLEGVSARDVLAKGIAIDLSADVFAVNQFALTGLDHTPILLHRTGPDRYEIFAMRTFALAVWDWLTDAALEFGYDVEPPAA